MIDAVRAVLTHHLPSVEIRSIHALGAGLDNAAFEVNGELVVRVSTAGEAADRAGAIRREAALLAVVAGVSPLPVPRPILVDVSAGVMAYPKLIGRPLMDDPVADPGRLAAPLGAFLARLHAIPPEAVRALVPSDDDTLAAWRNEAERHYREVATHLLGDARRAVEAFLHRSLPDQPAVAALCHCDLGTEHILVGERGEITGILDWTDAALADPMVDFARIYRDLGPDVADLAHAVYATARGAHAPWPAADRERTAFYARCALLEDLAYGIATGDRRYAESALAHLDRTFA